MKSISKILVIAIIVSMFTSFTSLAYDSAEQEIIDVVTEEKLWTDGEFNADKDITGAQLAAMIEKALGVDGKEIIPGVSSDKAVTRLELAIAADKVGSELIENYMSKKVFKEIYMDTDELTDAEHQSVANSVAYGFVLPCAGKIFAPEQKATCLEAAKAVLTIKSMTKKHGEYTVREVKESDDPEKFDVYQTGVIKQNNGVGGFGMLARFDGAPGEIYVAKSTVEPLLENQLGNVAPPVTVVRIIDPDGNIVARVNLDIVETGKIEKIVNITEGKAGIYTISFSNGRDGDVCEIAINGAKSWGVRGEHAFAYTDTTPKTGYVYIPKTSKHLSLATGGPNDTLTLTAPDGTVYELKDAPRQSSLQAIEIVAPTVDSVYTINAPDDFRNFFEIRGVSQLICPTKEMALDLKGGYIDIEDKYASWTLAGPLQARARAKMIEIYEKAEGNFEVTSTKPYEELPAMEDLDNPLAETQLFAAYYGSIPGMDVVLRSQCLDPANPWFGMVVEGLTTKGDAAYPQNTYLSEYFSHQIFYRTTTSFTGALSTNSQLNGYYNDPQLKDRVALAQLSCVLTMTQDCDIIDSVNPADDAGSWYLVYTNFRFPDWAYDYYTVRKMLDLETREICDTALMLIGERQIGMKGQGPTNQAAYNFYGTLAMYEGTGDEVYHEFFKRQVDGYLYPNKRPSYNGQAQAGYYIEAGGCDGNSYERHNEDFFSRAMLTYFNLPEEKQDPETVAKLKAACERNLNFMEKWSVGATDGLDAVYATNFSSRTRSGLGDGGAYIANNFLINYMPQQRSIWANVVNPPVATSAAYANSDEVAYENLKKFYPSYDKFYDNRPVNVSLMYEQMHEPFAESVTLPYQYEGDYNIWDQPGLVALKHKGIYMVSFYDNTLPRDLLACKSWHGGAPTFSWIEGLGHATTSDKPVNYSIVTGTMLQHTRAFNYKPYFKEEEFIHAGIVGTDANGEVFASGREKSKLTWIEEGKKFKISGVTPIEEKEVSWIYDMTDEGIEITAGIDSISGKEEFWMQIPVVDQSNKNADYKVTHENGKLVAEYRGKKMVMTWDASLEYKMNDHQPEEKVRTQVLKIKLPAENPNATIKIVAE